MHTGLSASLVASHRLPPAIFLMGPTASGKTGLAVELTDRLPVELISVDSALVYKDMDIGTAKPEAETLARAPHHLIDIIPPTDAYSAAQFRTDALRLMEEITARGHIPLLVGGTMLYFKALQGGLSALPQADAAVRSRLEQEAAAEGWPALHARLADIDAASAARIEPGDAQRIQRALEVFALTGKPLSAHFLEGDHAPLPYRILKIGLMPSDRAILHARIAERFDSMIAKGLLQEVIRLREAYPALSLSMPSMRCVGYRQAWLHLAGELNQDSFRGKGIAATRQLAKRQMTWMRSMDAINEVDCASNNVLNSINMVVGRFLSSREG